MLVHVETCVTKWEMWQRVFQTTYQHVDLLRGLALPLSGGSSGGSGGLDLQRGSTAGSRGDNSPVNEEGGGGKCVFCGHHGFVSHGLTEMTIYDPPYVPSPRM